MNYTNRGQFAAIMARLGEVFSKKITPELTELYWQALESLSIESIEFACQHHIQNSQHFPKPAEFRHVQQFKPRESLAPALEQHYPKWLALGNQLYFLWLWGEIKAKKRKRYRGPVDMKEAGIQQCLQSIPLDETRKRRAVCRQLAEDFEQMEREGDPAANRDWLRQAFDNQMKLIPVSNPA